LRSVNQIPKYHGLFAKPQDYFELENDGFRYELIHGRLVMAPSPTVKHQDVLAEILTEIKIFLRVNPIGNALSSPCDVHIGNEVYQPDILFIRNENKDVVITSHIIGAPDLVVEILSPSTAENDYGVKFDTYEKYGVKEYWIIDKFKSKNPKEDIYYSTVLSGFRLELKRLKEKI